MPNWKKVVVSGSSAHLNQITGSGGIHLPDNAKITLGDAEDYNYTMTVVIVT